MSIASGCGEDTEAPTTAAGAGTAGASAAGSGLDGGSTGHGGDAGHGGDSGHGGALGDSPGAAGDANGGAAGAPGEGIVARLGDSCSMPAALACAGNYQKVTLICAASGEWVTNETCEAGEYCDTTSGPEAGICRSQLPQCAEPHLRYCEGKALHECSADAVSEVLVEDCLTECDQEACLQSEPCPSGGVVNCAADCGGTRDSCADLEETECPGVDWLGDYNAPEVIRTPSAHDLCSCSGTAPQAAGMLIYVADTEKSYRLKVNPPWSFAASCVTSEKSQCLIVPPITDYDYALIWVVTNDADIGSHNVMVEEVPEGTECP